MLGLFLFIIFLTKWKKDKNNEKTKRKDADFSSIFYPHDNSQYYFGNMGNVLYSF